MSTDKVIIPRSNKIIGFVGLAAGIILLLTGFLMKPSGMPSAEIQTLRIWAVCIGILAAVYGANLLFLSRANGFFKFLSHMKERMASGSFSLAFCFICFFFAWLLGLIITQAGPGVSQDSWGYIRQGEFLNQGQGFQKFTGYPLYPLLIAGLMHFGFSSELAAGLIPVLSFAFMMFPLFFLGKAMHDVISGYVACLIALVFTPILYVASWAWSDMPYILFSTLAILFLVKYAEGSENKIKILCTAAIFTALAILTRYVGVAIVLVGIITILVKNRKRLIKAVPRVLVFGSISCLPVFIWLIRSYVLTSRIVGGGGGYALRETGRLTALHDNIVWIVRDVPYEFVRPLADLFYIWGWHIADYTGLIIIAICAIGAVIIAIIYPATRKVLLRYLENHYVVISYIFTYLLSLLIVQVTIFSWLESRFLSAVFPFAILVAISSIFYAYRQIKKHALKPTLFFVLVTLCAMLFAPQAIHSASYIQTAKQGQGYNEPVYRNSQAIFWVALNVPATAVLYSNSEYVIEFKLKRPTHGLSYRGDEAALNEWLTQLKTSKNVYVIYFKEPGVVTGYASYDEIMKANEQIGALEVKADFPEAVVWGVP